MRCVEDQTPQDDCSASGACGAEDVLLKNRSGGPPVQGVGGVLPGALFVPEFAGRVLAVG